MKKLMLVLAALCLFAAPAFAMGWADLTVNACSGEAGASNNAGTLDCAAGGDLVLLVTFQPAEAITDFVAADVGLLVDVGNRLGNIFGADNFWDLQTANTAALSGSEHPPVSGCANVGDPFNTPGSGSGFAAGASSPGALRLAGTAYRPTHFAVHPGQPYFSMQISVDLGTSAESGSTSLTGCASKVAFGINYFFPQSASGAPTTNLTLGSSLNANTVVANGSNLPVAATRHSWGQLKSLYR